jgi:hypothetical protein
VVLSLKFRNQGLELVAGRGSIELPRQMPKLRQRGELLLYFTPKPIRMKEKKAPQSMTGGCTGQRTCMAISSEQAPGRQTAGVKPMEILRRDRSEHSSSGQEHVGANSSL